MSPAERAARIELLHRRMQIERAALDRAGRALLDSTQPAEVRRMRALYELAKAVRRLNDHDTDRRPLNPPVLRAVAA